VLASNFDSLLSALQIMKILILTPSLTQHDAISNELVLQYNFLSKNGWEVHLYAEKVQAFSHSARLTYKAAYQFARDPACLVMYHHSIDWQEGEQLLSNMEGKLVIRYHGITPLAFFPDEPATQRGIRLGNEQTLRLAKHPCLRLVLCNSFFIQQDWAPLAKGKYPVEVVAPFHSIEDFPSASMRKMEADIHVLFVGRFTPHKGQQNLLRLLQRYRERYGALFHLHLVGKGSRKKTFLYSLYQEIFAKGFASHVHIHYDVEAATLAHLYQTSHLFVSFSEHEGFGLPLLEAQFHGLAVVALYRGAVKEVLGESALGSETLDLDYFCAAIHTLSTHPEMAQEVVEAGRQNFEAYKRERLEEKLSTLLGAGDLDGRK
jgi:glycosyltransferase involved in cell wall biosynthesis